MTTTLVATLMVVTGVVGVLVPVLPGLLLVWGGIAVWSVATGGAAAWTVLGVASVVVVGGTVAKYLLPGRRLRAAQVPWTSLGLGGALGVAGFFVLPVVGLPLGFVLGVYLGERARLHSHELAWPSTRTALAAVGWSILVELATAMLAIGVWIVGIILI